MRLFGRKKQAGLDDHWNGWPDTLDVDDGADVEWIKASNDPLVWHAAVLACLIYRGDRHGLVGWLVRQPGLDRVTAAAIFLHRSNGVARLQGKHLEYVQMTEVQVVDMIDTLCDLDAARHLVDNGIGMEPGWEAARLETIASLTGNPRVPSGILARPIDLQTATMPYTDIGEGDLVTRKFMRETMPFMLD